MNEPQPEPPDKDIQVFADDPHDILVIVDGPGDTTPRPRRPNIPRGWCLRPSPIPYEQLLARDGWWALMEAACISRKRAPSTRRCKELPGA